MTRGNGGGGGGGGRRGRVAEIIETGLIIITKIQVVRDQKCCRRVDPTANARAHIFLVVETFPIDSRPEAFPRQEKHRERENNNRKRNVCTERAGMRYNDGVVLGAG